MFSSVIPFQAAWLPLAAAVWPLLVRPTHPSADRRKTVLCCAGEEDDSDIKIAGREPVRSEDDDLKEAQELIRRKRNGDLEKARRLGRELARKIINEDGDPSFGSDESESDEIRRQRRMLLTFVVDYAVRTVIGSEVLGQVALSEFTDGVKRALPEFYEDIGESGSFSFYYLAVRRPDGREKEIGRTFAMLAGYENNTVMEELGEALFIHFNDIVDKCVRSYEFAK